MRATTSENNDLIIIKRESSESLRDEEEEEKLNLKLEENGQFLPEIKQEPIIKEEFGTTLTRQKVRNRHNTKGLWSERV